MNRVPVVSKEGKPLMPTKPSRAVRAEKSGKVYIGYVGGFTDTQKTKNISVCDYTWKRIGQFAPSKVDLIRRNNGLCVA